MGESKSTTAVAWWHWHRRLYDWVIHFSETRHGVTALFALSFAESSCFPVPPDVLLAPLALGSPRRWLRFALACSIASVLGGIYRAVGLRPPRSHRPDAREFREVSGLV